MRRQLTLSVLLLALAACSPTVANRGNIIDPERVDAIKPGVSTREDVIAKLGSPSNRSAFDDKSWYYIGRRTEQYSFLDPEVTDQQILAITFNDDGIVTALDKTGKDQIADITAAPGKTPSFGRETSWVQDLFSNIGRAGMPGSGRKSPQ